MRWKLLSASLLISTLALAENSFSNELKLFDYNRFGSRSTVNADEMLNQTSRLLAAAGDDFSIGPNGVLSRTGGHGVTDVIDNVRAVDVSARPASLTSDFIPQVEHLSGYISPAALCETSSLPPSEIEKLIIATANRYGVDPTLAAAVGWNESRFDQVRNSPKGARGPMQLLPEIASRFGVADICDPAANIEGGVRYLRVLLDKFQNPLLAAAAYNAGEQAIYDHHGIPPFPETVGYVAGVLNYQLGLRPPTDGKEGHARKLHEAKPEDTGVIGVASRAKFVAGVMQF